MTSVFSNASTCSLEEKTLCIAEIHVKLFGKYISLELRVKNEYFTAVLYDVLLVV